LRVVSFESSRVTQLFPLEEFAPVAGTDSPSVLSQIAQRYGFSIIPSITTRDDLNTKGLVFGMGHFQFEGQPFVISDFGVYTDGIVAVSERSEWSEAFLADVTSWVKNEFGFREISGDVRTLFNSTIIVDFETSPSNLLKNFQQITQSINERAVLLTAEKRQMDFARLDFEVDKRTVPGHIALPKFVIERRAGVDFAQERYFCSAPMRTSDHLEVLQEIERLAANA
jgi:hypothetical protein